MIIGLWIIISIVIIIFTNWVTYQLTKSYWQDELERHIESGIQVAETYWKLYDEFQEYKSNHYPKGDQ